MSNEVKHNPNVFPDNRGCLHSFRNPPFPVAEALFSQSRKNVFRGFHMSPYRKLVYVVQGSIRDMWWKEPASKEDHPESFSGVLTAGAYVLVPAHAAHAFLVLEDNTTVVYFLEQLNNPALDINVSWESPDLASFGLHEDPVMTTHAIISPKDQTAYYNRIYEYLVLGASGFLGGHIVQALEQTGHSHLALKTRLDHLMELEKHIVKSRCKYVICAAGISGKPTIDWCEDNQTETMETNFLYMLNLLRLCKKHGIVCVILGSGLIYKPVPANEGPFSETSAPSLYELTYCKYRIHLENYIAEHYAETALYLRILFPCSLDGHPKCFYQKSLARAKDPKCTIHEVSPSLTIVPDLFPKIPRLLQNGARGILNFVNKGRVHLPTLVRADPARVLSPPPPTARGNYELTTDLFEKWLGEPLFTAEEAIHLYSSESLTETNSENEK